MVGSAFDGLPLAVSNSLQFVQLPYGIKNEINSSNNRQRPRSSHKNAWVFWTNCRHQLVNGCSHIFVLAFEVCSQNTRTETHWQSWNASRQSWTIPQKLHDMNVHVCMHVRIFNVCHPEVFNTYINIQWCISQTQQNFTMFIIVLGQLVSILIESSSGPSKIQILT